MNYKKLIFIIFVLVSAIIVLHYGPYAKDDLVWYKMNTWVLLTAMTATIVLLIFDSRSSGNTVCSNK